jgi:hypothetical protein
VSLPKKNFRSSCFPRSQHTSQLPLHYQAGTLHYCLATSQICGNVICVPSHTPQSCAYQLLLLLHLGPIFFSLPPVHLLNVPFRPPICPSMTAIRSPFASSTVSHCILVGFNIISISYLTSLRLCLPPIDCSASSNSNTRPRALPSPDSTSTSHQQQPSLMTARL